MQLIFFIIIATAGLIAGVMLIGDGLEQHADYPRCRGCKYNLRGLPPDANRCPECGVRFADLPIILAGSRRESWRHIAAGILVVLVTSGGCVWSLLMAAAEAF